MYFYASQKNVIYIVRKPCSSVPYNFLWHIHDSKRPQDFMKCTSPCPPKHARHYATFLHIKVITIRRRMLLVFLWGENKEYCSIVCIKNPLIGSLLSRWWVPIRFFHCKPLCFATLFLDPVCLNKVSIKITLYLRAQQPSVRFINKRDIWYVWYGTSVICRI